MAAAWGEDRKFTKKYDVKLGKVDAFRWIRI